MFSSKNDKWTTPQQFFDKLDKTIGFTLDPCATEASAKCDTFYTEEEDGLTKDWAGYRAFVNPPYGRKIGSWVKKSYEESLKGDTVVALLIPARTDTKYWHEYCMRAACIYFVKGRLKFGDSKNAAPFPSAVIIFNGSSMGMPFLGVMDAK